MSWGAVAGALSTLAIPGVVFACARGETIRRDDVGGEPTAPHATTLSIPLVPSAPVDAPHELRVLIDARGAVRAVPGGAIESLPALRALCAHVVGDDPTVRAVIAADRAVPYRRVVEVLDAVRAGGIDHVSLAVAGAGGDDGGV